MDITIADLLLAYRKTKVDMYYSGLPCRNKLLDFEEQLEHEIRNIQNLLQTKNKDGLKELCFGYILMPKKVSFKNNKGSVDVNANNGFDESAVFSDPIKEYSVKRVDKCQLRLMSDLPVSFHVIMTWWIMKIGEKLEKCVSAHSYGNRIRRKSDGSINEFSMGTFTRYLHQYHAWRDNGIKVIRNAVEAEKKDVLAVTADFTAFYHKISPRFLSNPNFFATLGEGAELTADECAYTDIIVWMIEEWAKSTPLKQGLPVGCSVSAVIANLALRNFDENIERDVVPLYYGRYVDDIIVVLENTNHFTDSISVWKWLARRIDGLDVSELNESSTKEKRIYYKDVIICPDGKSQLSFESDKTKVFLIDKESGGLLINSLERQIKARSSEWRALPDFPESEGEMTSKILSACTVSGEEVDNLRKVDVLSLKRAVFAMAVRDFESYGRNLTPRGWYSVRMTFLNLIDKHFTDIKSFFDLQGYFPRIIATTCNCSSDDDVEVHNLIVSIIDKLYKVTVSLVTCDCDLEISGGAKCNRSDCIAKLREYMGRLFAENIAAATDAFLAGMNIRLKVTKKVPEFAQWFNSSDWGALYDHDLAYQPARTAYTKERIGNFVYNNAMYPGRSIKCCGQLPAEWTSAIKDFLKYWQKHTSIDAKVEDVDVSLLFPTRPISTFELSKLFLNPYSKGDIEVLSHFLKFERGYEVGDRSNKTIFPTTGSTMSTGDKEVDAVINVAWSKQAFSVNIALANWLTDNSSYNAAVCQVPDPNEIERYGRLMNLVNEIIASKIKVQYVVFPELSLPSKWFEQIALKLRVSGISLIAGVEYIHESDNKVRNQVWCSLLHDGCGFPQISVYKFEKSRAALHEADELLRRANQTLTSNVLAGHPDIKPIVRHGDLDAKRTLDFSAVICSELTNVDYLSQLRGRIDVLFVPSWNQDADVFSSIVESAAYDIHTYVVQCNDRAYGDTRIRAPAKERYNRDVVKIKGGEKDYYVIGRIDIEKLRRFQSFPTSPTIGKDATFKPIPCGFKMSDSRRILPQ